MRECWLSTLLVLALAAPASAASKVPLPEELKLSPSLTVTQSWHYHYSEFEFRVTDRKNELVRGELWQADVKLANVPREATKQEVWDKYIAPSLLDAGWKVVDTIDHNPFYGVLRYQKGGKDAWAQIEFFGPTSVVNFYVVEVGTQPRTVTLPAPGPKPEMVDPKKGDFPYLPPIAGSRYQSGGLNPHPLLVRLPGTKQDQSVGTGTITRSYAAPEGASSLELSTAYLEGLKAAGWQIVSESHGLHQSDFTITAHYGQHGRDLWTYVHGTPHDYSFAVADVGAIDLGAQLNKECHAVLDGVLFDFDKATLKDESTTVLDRVAALLKSDPKLRVEVQGHTDAVGNDDYNLKLSEARAQSVVAWLTAHGIAAARLSAKGYGKTRPIADNKTDEGRAKNRRVEIADPSCTPK